MKRIENHVEQLLLSMGIDSPPISLEKIAKQLGLFIQAYDLGPGVSGALFLDKNKAVIGVNPSESEQRRRFTIAHEIGHYFLHKKSNALFVDKDVLFRNKEIGGTQILFRDDSSSLGEVKMEREANAFAAALLMPANMLVKKINSFPLNSFVNDEEIIKELAKKFNVSQIAMTYRLTNLGILD